MGTKVSHINVAPETSITLWINQAKVGSKHESTISCRFGFSSAAATRSLSFNCLFTRIMCNEIELEWSAEKQKGGNSDATAKTVWYYTRGFCCMRSRSHPDVHLQEDLVPFKEESMNTVKITGELAGNCIQTW